MNEKRPAAPSKQLAFLAVAAFAIVVCLFGNLGAIGLVGPDEPRYLWIARAMAKTGDWITPRLYGQPWFEKPALYYWLAAIGFRLHLPTEWAARLPSAIAALAAAVAVGWLGWKYYDRERRFEIGPTLLAPLIFSTSVAAIGFARSASSDMLFSVCMTLVMAFAAEVFSRLSILPDQSFSKSSAGLKLGGPVALFGFFLGLGALAKGPAAVALAGGAIGLWALVTGQWRAAFRVAHPLAIGTFSVVALPWYILCAHRNPEFLQVFLLQHNIERYLTPMFQHRQPFWFFGPITLLALLPWTAALWPVATEGLRLWREKRWSHSPGFYFACWAAFPIFFFSLSQSKLPGYILPAIPPLALLCAISLLRTFEQRRPAALGVTIVMAATCIGAAVAAAYYLQRFDWSAVANEDGVRLLSKLSYAAVAFATLIAAALTAAGIRRNLSLAVGACALWVALSVEAASLAVLPPLDHFDSARPHAQFMRNDRHPDRIFTYGLSRSWHYGLAFYFGRELPEWSPSDPQPALVLTTAEGGRKIQGFGRVGGSLDAKYAGVLYVPVTAAPVSH